MNQSNKALRDAAVKKLSEILGWDILDKWDEELLTKAADQILSLVTNHIKGLDCMKMEGPYSDKTDAMSVFSDYGIATRNKLRQQILKEMGQ